LQALESAAWAITNPAAAAALALQRETPELTAARERAVAEFASPVIRPKPITVSVPREEAARILNQSQTQN
jgi:hypothetical protein